MDRGDQPPVDATPRSSPIDRLNLDRFERLAERLRGRPAELLRLTRWLTLTTLDDLRRRGNGDGGPPPAPESGREGR